MMDFLAENFLWIKALHVISVIAWMAGLFYLPRLFVYHARVPAGSEMSETFKVMESKLLRIIMNPAMIASWLFAIGMIVVRPDYWSAGWFHAKLLLVVLLTVMHMVMASWRRVFAEDRNTRSHVFYRYANEVPTLLMIAIVILAVVEPF